MMRGMKTLREINLPSKKPGKLQLGKGKTHGPEDGG